MGECCGPGEGLGVVTPPTQANMAILLVEICPQVPAIIVLPTWFSVPYTPLKLSADVVPRKLNMGSTSGSTMAARAIKASTNQLSHPLPLGSAMLMGSLRT